MSRIGGRDQPFGPVDLYVIGLPAAQPDPAAMAALMALVGTGQLRLLDLILVSKAGDGGITITERHELPADGEIHASALGATGIVGEDDVRELASMIPLGAAALVVAVELVYQRELAARAAESGAVLLGHERIPAPVVNALIGSMTTMSER
jgi:hypothetical protein